MSKLSIILPSIRIERIPFLYSSIKKSYDDEFEVIVISPYAINEDISSLDNIIWIQDWGSPVRCQSMALEHCSGDYVTRAVDDSFYITDSLTKAMKLADPETVVNLKFTESNNSVDFSHQSSIRMDKDDFYDTFYHKQTLQPYVAHNYKIINFGIYPTQLLKDIGGWDSVTWETIALAELDLSIRLQFNDTKIKMTPDIVLRCDWEPGESGTHAPLHYAFDDDMKKYREIYSNIDCWNRVKISRENWKQAPERWVRRFGNKNL